MKPSENKTLAAALQRQEALRHIWQPQEVMAADLEEFLMEYPGLRAVDRMSQLFEELFRIEHPAIEPNNPEYFAKLERFLGEQDPAAGRWMFYPWNDTLVRVLEPELHSRLRTARNRNLITEEEQKTLAAASVGVAGLSVGSHAVTALMHSGPFARIKIADADTIDLTNLNRILAGTGALGLPKATVMARKIYELDPYATVEVYPEGLTAENLADFVDGLNVVVDEMDDLPMKARLRLAAKAARVPLVMVTDNGDNGLLDLERFDLHPDLEPFHGFLTKEELAAIVSGTASRREFVALSMKIIGAEHAPLRLLQSLPEIGRTLAGVPQLGASSMLSGAIAAYVVRLVLTGQPVRAGKVPVNLEQEILPHYAEVEAQRQELLKHMGVRD